MKKIYSTDKKIVEYEEFYRKENGIVIRYWRNKGDKTWRGEPTVLKEVPYKV